MEIFTLRFNKKNMLLSSRIYKTIKFMKCSNDFKEKIQLIKQTQNSEDSKL